MRSSRLPTALPQRKWWLAAFGALAFSCLPQSQVTAPEVAVSSTLDLDREGKGKPIPFAVVHAGPSGTTTGDPSIQVVFSRPLKELGVDVQVPEGLAVSPATPGHWEWVGVHGLTFVPEAGRLKRATAYTVKIPESLKSLDGQTLTEGKELHFITPVPVVTNGTPSGSWYTGRPADKIQLNFSQPVTPQALRNFVEVFAGTEKQEISLSQGKQSSSLVVTSTNGWPLDSEIRYQVLPGYQSSEGPEPAQKKYEARFKIYGPLTAKVECHRKDDGSCRPESDLRLELSNPVPALKLARSIRATGVQLNVDQDWGPESTTRYISLGAELKPRQEFTVVVDPIVDIYGQPLKWVKNRQVRVADRRPLVRIGFSGDSIPLSEKHLAIQSINASYELVTAPLNATQLRDLSRQGRNERMTALRRVPGAKVLQVPVGALNQTKQHLIDLDSIIKHGPFGISIRYQSEGNTYEDVRWGQRTDLGVTVKQGRDRAHAWITRLPTGAPIEGATVRVDGSSQLVKTNAQGLVELPPGRFLSRADYSKEPEWLEVAADAERSYRSNERSIDSWRLDVHTDFHGDQQDLAFLFPERDLFRPGETAWLKAYIRRPTVKGNAMMANTALSIALVSPDGETVTHKDVSSNRFGAVAAQLKVPQSGALGYWTAQLKRGKEVLASSALQVAEYRRSEFEVHVETDVPSVVSGEAAAFNVSANYFYGGVMADAAFSYTIYRNPAYFVPEGLSEYVASDSTWQYHEPYRGYSRQLAAKESKLDELGTAMVGSTTKLVQQVGPEYLEFEGTVQDVSGQTSSARKTLLVHPANNYVAIKRPESYLVDAPGSISPQVRTVTPEGKNVSGRSVQLSLYRLRWTHAKRQSGDNSDETVSELVRDLVTQCTVKSSSKDESCALSFQHSGQYLVRATTTDSQGRKVASTVDFYAVGGGGVSAWQDDDERSSLDLKADREMYEPGRNARILIKSPFEKARAWLTIERDGVLSQKVINLSGPSPTATIPITEAMRPNAYVSVHLLEDRKALGSKAHTISESYRVGYADLRINPERQRLSVDVKAHQKQYKPGENVKLDFAVKDKGGKGRSSEVTVFVVDEGVLSLSGYQLPDPLLAFTKSRPLRVETIEGRENIAILFGLEPGLDEQKGDPGGGGGEERSDIVTTAYFNPSIVTDAQGRASTTFKLPDNLGKFRIMALAVTEDDRYGKGESSFNVNKPLMIRPALPRFLRAGDQFEMSAVISGLDFPGGEITLSAQAEGLELLGEKSKKFQLKKGASVLVGFKARASQVGPARVHFLAQGNSDSDAVALNRQVHSPAQLEAVALYGKTKNAEAHRIGALDDARKDMGQLDVTLSSSALVGLKGGFEQLWDYPYLCSEQLSSRILPLVMLRELGELYGVELPSDSPKRIERTVADLVKRQRGDGGFGMWPESIASSPWVSAYALWVLAEAKARGSLVSQSVFERGARYLQDLTKKRDEMQLSTAAFAAFALSKIGKGDKNTINSLMDDLEQMPVESQTMLLWAAAASDAPHVVKELLPRVESTVTLRGNRAEITAPHGDSWAATMGSTTRLHAIALSALLAGEPDHVLAAPLARSLLEARTGNGWGSTQEAAFSLVALDAYRRAQEKEEPHFDALVFLKDKLLGQKRFVGRSTQAQDFSVEMAKLVQGGDLVFQQKGSGTLFFEARLKYARKTLPQTSLESGFLVQKTITALGTPEAGPLKPGQKSLMAPLFG